MRPTRKLTDSRCQCSGCGEYFNSDAAFDKHRIGRFGVPADQGGRRCMSPDEMGKAGMAYKTQPGGQKWWVGSEWEGPVRTSGEAINGGSGEGAATPVCPKPENAV